MKRTTLMDEDKLLEQGVRALMRDLGPVETPRFLALLPGKRAESVKRHRAWQSRLDKKTFFEEVFAEK